MSDETTSQFTGDSLDPVEAAPESQPSDNDEIPQGPPQEDTQRKIYPTDPTGADPDSDGPA